MAGLTGFSFYKTITISHANVDVDLTNFPVFVPIVNDANIGAVCRADGFDVQFADATNDNVLTFERLTGFAVASGQANGNFYVLVPTVAGATDTLIRCYYGKTDATDVSSPENTFATANGWVAVWHFEEASGNVLDATSGNHDSSSAAIEAYQQSALMGYSARFNGSTNGCTIPDHTDFAFAGPFTVMVIVKADVTDDDGNIWWAYSSNWIMGIQLHQGSFGSGRWESYLVTASGDDWIMGTSVPTQNWQQLVFSRDGNDDCYFYIDTVNEYGGSRNIPGTLDPAANYIGKDSALEEVFDGCIDELRISNVDRGASWVKFEFYNLHDGHAVGNELTWGAETATGEGAVYIPKVIMVM